MAEVEECQKTDRGRRCFGALFTDLYKGFDSLLEVSVKHGEKLAKFFD